MDAIKYLRLIPDILELSSIRTNLLLVGIGCVYGGTPR